MSRATNPNPIILALDVPDADAALRLADIVGPHVGALKIGLELFTSAGPDLVRRIRDTGVSVFLDLKFHDIPNTVAKAVAAATRLDVQMLTVHASGGAEMMRAAEASAVETARSLGRTTPLVLGVTVLTSMDGTELRSVSLESDPGRQVERLAQLALVAGLRGLVCSPLELGALRSILPSDFQRITPGIRLTPPKPGDDQKRTLGPVEALAAGAHWLVIGRPIYAATDPASAARDILALIQ
ncbi:MAG: orotidine-5'-phosphate decarboxylase [Limisphaerales bacterium]